MHINSWSEMVQLCIERGSGPILDTPPFIPLVVRRKSVAVLTDGLFCLFQRASLLSKFWEEEACKANLDNECAVAPAAGRIGGLLLLNAMIDELENKSSARIWNNKELLGANSWVGEGGRGAEGRLRWRETGRGTVPKNLGSESTGEKTEGYP